MASLLQIVVKATRARDYWMSLDMKTAVWTGVVRLCRAAQITLNVDDMLHKLHHRAGHITNFRRM